MVWTRPLAEAAARFARLWSARRAATPLAYARLWDQPLPRTSQRRTLLGLGKTSLVLGGNRTGKTELGAQLAVAMALGMEHPHVQAWCALNGLPLDLVPDGPGKVCASALTSGDSLRYLREKLDRYLPAGSTWHNRFGQGEAWVLLPNRGQILCKSNDQGRRSYQGDSWRFAWLDEEHDAPIYDEIQMRLLDQGGTTLMSMTPLKGFTWVKDRFLDKPDLDDRVHYLHMQDNPHLPPEEVKKAIRRMSSHQRDARTRGLFVALEGLVYPEWQPHLHVVDPFAIPGHWPRYRGIDFGVRAPFCCLWFALDPKDDTLYLYREHYEAERTTEEHAGIITELEKQDGRLPEWTAADPADLNAIRTLQRKGMENIRHPGWMKNIKEGINDVKDRLRPDAEGNVHFKVFRGCTNFIREMHGLIWSKTDKEEPDKACPDHALDAARYAIRCLNRDLKMTA